MSAQTPPRPLAVPEEFVFEDSSPESQDNRLSMSSIRSLRSMLPTIDISKSKGFRSQVGMENIARRTLGIFLLLVTVFLWTASNFLASFIFADNSYSKPYFVTYINTSLFAISLIPIFLRIAYQKGIFNVRTALLDYWNGGGGSYQKVGSKPDGDEENEDPLVASHSQLLPNDATRPTLKTTNEPQSPEGVLSVRETAVLSLEFCMLWFIANYLVAACLEYTSVASSTILTSTSSIWTLIFGALMHVEGFSYKKLAGVLASLAGIILISSVDLSGKDNDKNRGNFPHKTQGEIAIGDAMAFGSAIMYGIYAIVMKKRIGNEDRVNMPLFFGLVGFFNVVFLWPGFFILHYTELEKFELPSTSRIWTIVLLNSISSFVSDYCWAYAMLLTTPLVVSVGLTMTIPLSLIGQMIISAQYSSALYWVGAVIVLLSFLVINHESKDEEPLETRHTDASDIA